MCRINLSDVVRPLVDLLLRDRAQAGLSAIGHPELNPFEQRFGAVGDWFPCHVSFLASTLEDWVRSLAGEVVGNFLVTRELYLWLVRVTFAVPDFPNPVLRNGDLLQ